MDGHLNVKFHSSIYDTWNVTTWRRKFLRSPKYGSMFSGRHCLTWKRLECSPVLRWLDIRWPPFSPLMPHILVCFWRDSPPWGRASSFTRILGHTQRRTIIGGNPLDEWSARRRDLYLTTHIQHSQQTSVPPVGIELTISAGEVPQTYA